jgi:polysaccharide deacetylase family protein (PEP-CTERM system associated)
MINAMSIDLEDWFCAYNMRTLVPLNQWDQCELRVRKPLDTILQLLEKYDVRATFFVLGAIGKRIPELLRDIESRGHEIASHGYSHTLLTSLTPEEFDQEISLSLEVLREAGIKQKSIGYRAPSFTIVKDTLWALPILEKHQFKYDSSVFPVGFHPDYGIADAPLKPYPITEKLMEFPLSCAEWRGTRFPCSGGAYFRFFPYRYIKTCIRKCNSEERPVVFYIHPWEFDAEQPRLKLPWKQRIRHYHNLHKVRPRFERLLQDFKFTTISEVLHL